MSSYSEYKNTLEKLGSSEKTLVAAERIKGELNQRFKETQEKIAKISDDVEHFLNSKNYNFLLKKLPSKGFQSSLLAKIEDPSLKNFISNNGKHFIALKKKSGEIHSVESSSQAAKSYDVIKHKDNSWTCSCNSYLYKKSPKNEDCKHIDKLKLEKTGDVIRLPNLQQSSNAKFFDKGKILAPEELSSTFKNIPIINGDFEDSKILAKGESVLHQKGKHYHIKIPALKKDIGGRIAPATFMSDSYPNSQNINKQLSEVGKIMGTEFPQVDISKLSFSKSRYFLDKYKIPQIGLGIAGVGGLLYGANKLKQHFQKTASAYVTHHSQETQTSCSSACAKMVLDYYGIYKTEEECSKLIGVHSKGAENNQISEMLTKLGLKCINKELTPEEVKQFLDMNCPIIIDGKSFKYPDKFHYTVLSDLDLEKDVAVIFDPNYDKKIRTLTLKELDEIWHSKQMYKPHKPLVRQGIVVIGHEKTAEESTFQKYKPYIAGAGGLLAGAAAYKGLRRFNPSANKGLATLQNAMKDKKLAIQVDKASKLHTPIFGAKTVDRTTKDLGKDYGVLNHSTSTRAIPSGGPAINTDLANALDNKVTFDKIMNQGVGFGPSQVANPTAKNTDYLHGALKDVGGDINRLKAKYPEFIMKPATGSLGQVENLVTSADHPMFQKALKDEGMARNMLIQEKLPIDKEFRVHTLNGVPFSSMNRRIENSTLRKAWEKLTGSSGGGAFIPTIGKERQALNQFVSDAHKHIQPAFEQGHNLHSAYDVAKLKDGTYRMIESNPTPGTLMNPIINRKLQRMATGRWGKDVATLGALSAGAATSAGTANLE